MKILFTALAALLVAAPLAAQGQSDANAEAQQPTFRTGVDVITVDVGAVDSRGQPVTDLHAPEFTVKIDGQQRRVITADLVKYNIATLAGWRVLRFTPRMVDQGWALDVLEATLKGHGIDDVMKQSA